MERFLFEKSKTIQRVLFIAIMIAAWVWIFKIISVPIVILLVLPSLWVDSIEFTDESLKIKNYFKMVFVIKREEVYMYSKRIGASLACITCMKYHVFPLVFTCDGEVNGLLDKLRNEIPPKNIYAKLWSAAAQVISFYLILKLTLFLVDIELGLTLIRPPSVNRQSGA